MKMTNVEKELKKWGSVCRIFSKEDKPIYYQKEMLDFAKQYHQSQVNNVVLDGVSERYLLIEWLNGNPMIDGSIYFDSKEDCLTYWQDLPKTDLFDITYTICRITNVR